ncbi:C39 family peptidase [Actinomadura parmotrematis]|uniref:C39 family peptidase n=1 Tax=Actinomadura parmotrematis TaxID=2864039 RepID=A0ABS7FUC0_9ACTN|nr:C39 family peptidase [Actinomadura parmotrematis]MBW8483790.1 C39 family peptidase [Actinomadura parmotrematis]
MRTSTLLVPAAVAAFAVPLLLAAPAEAASWSGRSGAAHETCTSARTYSKVTYTTCLQYNSAYSKVRVVTRVSTKAKRKVAAAVYLKVPGRSHNLSAPTCSATLASGAGKQCDSAWLNANRVVQNGTGTVTISGHRVAGMVVRGTHLSAKKQENSAKYCGPATVQAALRTIKGSAPTQDTLANKSNLHTNQLGFTNPGYLDNVLNRYKPSGTAKYHVYDFAPVGQSSELAFRQIHRSITAGNPVVYLVDPSKLPWSSNPTGTKVRHYILLHGFAATRTSTDTNLNGGLVVGRFTAWDPARGGDHNITVPQLIHASTASQYIDDDMVFAAK